MAMTRAGEDKVLSEGKSDAEQIKSLQDRLSMCRKDLQEYIMAEKVMIAAGRITEDAVNKAHDIVRGL